MAPGGQKAAAWGQYDFSPGDQAKRWTTDSLGFTSGKKVGRNSPLYLMALLGKQDSLSLSEQFLVWDLRVTEDPSPPLWVV